MSKWRIFLASLLLTMGVLLSACTPKPPEGALSAADLLEIPVYEIEVQVYGKLDSLGELLCPCFLLTFAGETIEVWHGLMVEEDGTERPAVSVEGIENGDTVVVTGELRPSSGAQPSRTFWAVRIERL